MTLPPPQPPEYCTSCGEPLHVVLPGEMREEDSRILIGSYRHLAARPDSPVGYFGCIDGPANIANINGRYEP